MESFNVNLIGLQRSENENSKLKLSLIIMQIVFAAVNFLFSLFLSILLCFTVCTHLLLAHGAPVKVKNLNGWSPLAEAISYGDRQTSECVKSKYMQIFVHLID